MDSIWNMPIDGIAPRMEFRYYAELALMFMGYFVVMHFILHWANLATNALYRSKSTTDRHEYRAQMNSIVHAVPCIYLSVYATFYTW